MVIFLWEPIRAHPPKGGAVKLKAYVGAAKASAGEAHGAGGSIQASYVL